MIRKLVVVMVVLMTLGAGFAAAQTKTPVVNQRQRNQQARIHKGVKNGQLTHREARRLEAQQRKIQADKLAAKSDGKVTPAERRHLRREQNRASKHIYRLKHNARKSGS